MNTKQATSHSLGETFKALFKQQGLSQEKVSAETGIPITSLSRKLNSGIFKYEEMCSIAALLGIPLSKILKQAELAETERRLEAVA